MKKLEEWIASLNVGSSLSEAKRRTLLFLSLSFVLFLFVGAFHHHPDGLRHGHCIVCYLVSHHSEFSTQVSLFFDPAFVALEAVLPSERPFRPFLSFAFYPGRSPPFLALS